MGLSLGRRGQRRPPTDYELLHVIYWKYRADHTGDAAQKVFLPIDLHDIARDLRTEPNMVFGRLYHHLNPKYVSTAEKGELQKALFISNTSGNLINFPLLEALYAGLAQERSQARWVTGTAVLSLAIAIASLVVSFLR